MTQPADQRRAALTARKRLTPGMRQELSARACARLARLPAVRRARRIGLYWPLASEIDPRPLQSRIVPPVAWFLPRVVGERLCFVRLGARHGRAIAWQRSALGVYEPRGPAREVGTLDVLIMPLAAFDDRAERIGLGGGFYDRTLADVRALAYRSPTRIGLAFEAQHVGPIRPNAWDVPLDAVVSERRVYRRRA